jgi:hypothetical protein
MSKVVGVYILRNGHDCLILSLSVALPNTMEKSMHGHRFILPFVNHEPTAHVKCVAIRSPHRHHSEYGIGELGLGHHLILGIILGGAFVKKEKRVAFEQE